MDPVSALTQLGGTSDWEALLDLTSRRQNPTAPAAGTVVRSPRGRYTLADADRARRAAARVNGVLALRSAALHHGWPVKFPAPRSGGGRSAQTPRQAGQGHPAGVARGVRRKHGRHPSPADGRRVRSAVALRRSARDRRLRPPVRRRGVRRHTKAMFEHAGFEVVGVSDAVASKLPRLVMRRDLTTNALVQ